MKAHITNEEQAHSELQTYMSTELKEASLNGFMLGGHSAMKMASDKFGDRIRNAADYDTLKGAALELLDYLEDKAKGLKNVAGGEN